jgi:tRNA1(Val) A37 N6-methylase TrmN6
MAEASSGPRPESAPDAHSRDAWLGGRLTLLQPRRGHRAGSDAALLAAAADFSEGRFVDVGAGVGTVGLSILSRSARVSADLVEIDPALARLAADNVALNGLSARVRVLNLDVGDARARREAGLAADQAAGVVTNPPFFEPGSVRRSPDARRAQAHVFSGAEATGAPLATWVRACLAILKPGGRFLMIHRPDALAPILEAAQGRLGALALLPVYPRAGGSAHRLLVSGVKGSRAPLRIAPPLVLHEADGRLTAEADAIHRGEALIDWADWR